MPNPAIDSNPDLGISESVRPGITIQDARTPTVGLPYVDPQNNMPADDAHRINHAIKATDHLFGQIALASLLGMDAHLFITPYTP